MLLFVLSLCGFASAMSGRIVDPVVTDIAADLAAPIGVVALLSTAYTLPFALSQPLLGPLGDIFAKARIVKIGTAMLAVLLVAAAFAPSLSLLYATRIFAGIAGAAILPISFALIGDSVPMARRQLAMSRFLAATLTGQVVGATASGVLSHSLGWRISFIAAAAVTATIALAAALRLPETKVARSAPVNLSTIVANYRHVIDNPRAKVCFGVVFIEGAVIYGWLPFLGDYLQNLRLGGVREAGLVISGIAIGGIGYTALVPILLKWLDRRQMMAVGGIFAAAGLAATAFGPAWQIQWAFMAVTGFGFFLLHNPIQTEVSELAPDARASAFSLHSLSFYVGQAIGPILYGAGSHTIGLPNSLMLGSVGFLVAGLSAWLLLGGLPVSSKA